MRAPILLFVGAALGGFASAEHVLGIPYVSRAPSLADFVGERPRENESSVTDFRQNQPGDGEAASQPTTAYLSYDDNNLYAIFVCKSAGPPRARLTKRENFYPDDSVTVFLDTMHDGKRAYLFS